MLKNITLTEIEAVMLIRDEDKPNGGYAKYEGNCRCYQLVYKLSGKNRLLFEAGEYEERENSLRFLPKGRAGANYEVYSYEQGECIDICFQTAEPIEDDCFVCYFENNTRMRSLFVQLERLWRTKCEGYYYASMALFYEVMSELEKKTQPYRPSREVQMIRPATDYLEEHFLDPIEFSELSRMCGISDSYFRKLFHRQYGVSPVQFVNRRKIRYGCDLLSTGQYTVTQVAELARYDNVFYFSKVFKQIMGVSPTQFIRESMDK